MTARRDRCPPGTSFGGVMLRSARPWKFRVVAVSLFAGAFFAWRALAAGGEPPGSFPLGEDAVVDARQRVVYVTNPEGGIDAVDLANGEIAWSTRAAAKPLAVVDGRLVAQADPGDGKNQLQVVVLDTTRKGATALVQSITLPEGVAATVRTTPEHSFVVEARPSGGSVTVTWKDTRRVVKGVTPQADARDATSEGAPSDPMRAPGPAAKAVDAPAVTTGAFEFDLASRKVTPRKRPSAREEAPDRDRPVPAQDALPGPKGRQFLSADGRHVLRPERVAGDEVFDRYKWTLFDRGARKAIGTVRAHASWAPFAVVDSRLIYVSGRSARRVGEKLVEEPRSVRAVDLASGKVAWSRVVREPVSEEVPP